MRDSTQQIRVEKGMLNYLIEGLRTTLAWKAQGGEASRKLSTLRFIAHSFQRHLERLMTLEECDGYMDVVLETRPQMRDTVAALRQDHNCFRKEIRELIQGLEHVAPSDQATTARICDDLVVLLKQLDEHHAKEVDVYQETFDREEGGGD